MKVSVPQIGQANPVRIASYDCYAWLVIQVIGPNTLYLADNPNDLIQVDDPTFPFAGVQVNQATGVFETWWKGELWAAGSVAFTFLMVAPGTANSILGTGGMAA